LYEYPEFYDLGFCSYRDTASEVDAIEKILARHSTIAIKSIIEIACGPAPNVRELVGRGYKYTGLDASPHFVAYDRKKYSDLAPSVDFVEGDMRSYRHYPKADLALLMCGSLCCISTEELESHFDSVASSLNAGGLYLLDSCVDFEFKGQQISRVSLDHDSRHLEMSIDTHYIDCVNQLAQCDLTVEVFGGEQDLLLKASDVLRVLFPQELLLIVDVRPDFEFVGWWHNWDIASPINGRALADHALVAIRRL
jgi:Methyltransferase domain